MLWVTFGYAQTTGMTVMVGANVKDENYFAEPKGLLRALGKTCARLLLGTGKSTVAQLPERHLAAHLLAIGLA
jgi:hypothetical protein